MQTISASASMAVAGAVPSSWLKRAWPRTKLALFPATLETRCSVEQRSTAGLREVVKVARPSPGFAARHAASFQDDPSVVHWAVYEKRVLSQGPSAFLQDTLQDMTLDAASDPQAALYWAYHTSRFAFFTTQALVPLLLDEAIRLAPAAAVGGESFNSLMWEEIKQSPGPALSARLAECCHTWMQDLAWIQAGVYKLPWDMVTPNKQYNPAYIASRASQFLTEVTSSLRRAATRQTDPVWLRSPAIYPQYYNTYHYQTDGWLSDWSASIYEHSTETLFQGRQDAMQRSALVPLSQYLRAPPAPLASMRLLEVAAGTGRFHTFIKDNWPEMDSVCSDMSPFYLQRARENIKEWKRLRKPDMWYGGSEGTGVDYVQMAAEKISAPDQSFDIVVCVYLFHELPDAVRRKAVAEWFRVLKPGGLCVLTDSIQLGDRPDINMDTMVQRFGDFNEPYYANYAACGLGAMFQRAGFVPQSKYLSSVTKTLSFIKPHTA